MGAPRDEPGAAKNADVQVVVTLTRPFLLQQHELTQRDWVAAGFPNPSGTGPDGSDCADPSCPVGNITWTEAASFANHLSRKAVPALPECYVLEECTGAMGKGLNCKKISVSAPRLYDCKGFRLPTEAEWEYAARAGTTTAFYAGPMAAYAELSLCRFDSVLDQIAWYCDNSGKVTHPGGKKAPNGWGLFDTSGNAAEWVNDHYDGRGYGAGPLVDPVGTTYDPEGRVLRGGFVNAPPVYCKSSRRFGVPWNTTGPTIGARLARTL